MLVLTLVAESSGRLLVETFRIFFVEDPRNVSVDASRISSVEKSGSFFVYFFGRFFVARFEKVFVVVLGRDSVTESSLKSFVMVVFGRVSVVEVVVFSWEGKEERLAVIRSID